MSDTRETPFRKITPEDLKDQDLHNLNYAIERLYKEQGAATGVYGPVKIPADVTMQTGRLRDTSVPTEDDQIMTLGATRRLFGGQVASSGSTATGGGGGNVPPTEIPQPVQPIDGVPFLLVKTEDGINATCDIEYDPAADATIPYGVTAHWVPDGAGRAALSTDYDYMGDISSPAGSDARHGKCRFVIPQPTEGPQDGRIYLTARTPTYKVPLVLSGTDASPNVALTISQANSARFSPPALPVSVTVAEKENSRWLRVSDQTGWFKLLLTIELPDDPVEGEWVSFWPSRDDKATWDGASLEFPITAKTQTFEIDYPIPEHDETWWGKATTSSPAGFNVMADAVLSGEGVTILGVQPPSANDVTGAEVIGPRYGLVPDKYGVWGVTLVATASDDDPNFWYAYWTRQWVDADGDPGSNPEVYGNQFNMPGQTITDAGNLDQPLPPDPAHRYMRTRWYVRNRIWVDTLQTNAFGAGVDHFDVEIALDAGDAPDDVEDFQIGNKKVDGTYEAKPEWDTLNERLLFDWGCYLPDDIRNLGGIGLWFKPPGGQWLLACKSTDWIAPVAESPYEDAFAVSGEDVPKAPEAWTFRVCSANRFGSWKLKVDGTPDGPEVTVNTIAPNKGITEGNLSSAFKYDLAKAKPGTLETAAFAASILPPEIVAALPPLPDLTNYPVGRLVVLTSDQKLYRSTGTAWTKAVDGADVIANSITAGKIKAGAIGTSQLYAGEILVGQGGGKPTKFKVVDTTGAMIAFLGADADGFYNWFKDIRIGPDINTPTIYASASGVVIDGASITIVAGSATIRVDPTNGLKVTTSTAGFDLAANLNYGYFYCTATGTGGYTGNDAIGYLSPTAWRIGAGLYAQCSYDWSNLVMQFISGTSVIHAIAVGASGNYASFGSLRVAGAEVIDDARNLKNVTLPEHTHDGRYYTKAEIDAMLAV